MTGAQEHADTAARHDLGPCEIVPSTWPYPCEAQDRHPDHEVFTCLPHRVWWHQAPPPPVTA